MQKGEPPGEVWQTSDFAAKPPEDSGLSQAQWDEFVSTWVGKRIPPPSHSDADLRVAGHKGGWKQYCQDGLVLNWG